MVIDTIKKSIGPAAKNWQIVLIHFVLLFFYAFGFIILVAIPFAVIFAGSMDLNMQNISDPINAFGNIENLLVQNLAGLAVAILALLLYLTIVSSVALYIFGATMGTLEKAVRKKNYRFGFSSFISEGNRFFGRILWLTFLLGLMLIALMICISIMAGIGSVFILPLLSSESGTVYFIGIFISLLMASVALAGFTLLAVAGAFSLVALVVDDIKAIAAFKKSLAFIQRKPSSILFLLAVTGIYLLAACSVMLITIPLGIIPLIGPLLSIPVSFVCNRFLGLVMITALIYFYTSSNRPFSNELAGDFTDDFADKLTDVN